MLILSQTKGRIVKNYDYITVYLTDSVSAVIGDHDIILGNYKSRERCELILEEIIAACANGEKVYVMPWE